MRERGMAVDLNKRKRRSRPSSSGRCGAGRARPLWAVRRQVRAGDADAGARRVGVGLRRGAPRPRVPGRARPSGATLRRPADAALLRAESDRSRRWRRIYLKREDLAHTGAHKINNALGQGLLAKRMGKQRIIAETGAGQHGVATATVCALLGLECIVYMGEIDIARQAPNVFRMKLLGAEVRPGHVRLAHAQGRHQRGDPRLGDQRRARPSTSSARSSARTPTR